MMRVVSIALVAAVAAASVEDDFGAFMSKFGKNYASEQEKATRFEIFKANVEQADLLNAAQLAAGGEPAFGITKFSDLTSDEFKTHYTNYVSSGLAPTASSDEITPQPESSLPKSVDWRKQGLVTPVKDQGQCGSCWAFSTTEQIESDWLKAGKSQVILAPQQIVDCDNQDDGCGGGDTVTAYAYVKKAGGMDTEKSYPYQAENGRCEFKKADVAASIEGYTMISNKKAEETTKMATYVANEGPVSVCLATGGWQSYTGGILKKGVCGGASEVDHCVQVVGYEINDSTPYWIVRNSWNTDWGINGYIHVEYGANACDIAGEATVARVSA